MKTLSLCLLLSTAAFADSTHGALALFVDGTSGADSNACTASGSSACATIQGAVNKIPKGLNDRASVTVAAGNYASFSISGFGSDIGNQTVTAGLLVDGTLVNSTLATSTPTGTASSATAGSTDTYGTLTDSDKTWSTNDLRGRFLVLTGGAGAGQVKVISTNTANVITIVGVFSTAPTSSTTYAIQDTSTFINTCGVSPPSATGTASTANFAVRVQGNSASTTITLRGLGISAACSFGVYQPDAATLALNRLQFTSTAGTASRIAYAGPIFIDTVASTYSGTTGTHVTGGPLAAVNASALGALGNLPGPGGGRGTIQNSLFMNGAAGVNTVAFVSSASTISENDFQVVANPLATANAPNVAGNHFTCDGSGGSIGLKIDNTGGFGGGSVQLQHAIFSNCNTAIFVNGPSAFVSSVFVVTATNSITTAIDVRAGGSLYLSTGNTWSATTEVSIDNAAVTSPEAAITSTNCLTNLSTTSRVCRI